MSENIGWTKMWMATRRTGLNGDKNHIASEAENLKRRQKYSIQIHGNFMRHFNLKYFHPQFYQWVFLDLYSTTKVIGLFYHKEASNTPSLSSNK